jgi:hypothetical protein
MQDLITTNLNNKKMKKKYYSILSIVLVAFVFVGCQDSLKLEKLSYVTFESTTYNFGVDIGSSNTRDIKIYTADIMGASRTFSVNVVSAGTTADPASYTVPTTVTIPAGSNEGTLSITISDTNISSSGETIELAFAEEAGLFSSQNLVLNVSQVCPFNEVKLEITFDTYPEETSWEMYDGSGTLIASGNTYDGLTSFETKWCLPDGNYQFVIYDVYADGICCSYGNGSYKLTANGAVVVEGGSFGASETTTFSLP